MELKELENEINSIKKDNNRLNINAKIIILFLSPGRMLAMQGSWVTILRFHLALDTEKSANQARGNDARKLSSCTN